MKFYMSCLFCTIILAAGLVFTETSYATPKESLIITGTGSSIGTMQLLAAAFEKKRPHVEVKVLPSIGSTGGINAVKDNKIDIGLSYRPLKPEERGAGIIEEKYGRTPFIFAVQEGNPATGLTLAEIEEMYNSSRKSWPDGTQVRLILRPLADGMSNYLSSISPGLKSASEKAHGIPGVFVGSTDQEAAAHIEKISGAFGISTNSLVISEKRKIKALQINGAAPTPANLASGRYPYSMMLSIVYKSDRYRGALKDFVEFIFSKEGKNILSKNGHLPQPRTAGK